MRTLTVKSVESSQPGVTGAEAAREPGPFASLQRTAGNQAIVRAMSRAASARNAERKIGAVHDAAEDEADRVASEVMKAPQPHTQHPCACGGSCDHCSSAGEHLVPGGGAPLDASARADMESRFGHDFADVRVHTGADAAESAASMEARAYTLGRDIVFGAGEYRPHTEEGRRLLAHELAHVTQPGNGTIRRKMKLASPEAPAPRPEKTFGPMPTRAFTLQMWLDELCRPGAFIVNPSTGAVTAASKSSCRRNGKSGCECLCKATSTARGAKDIEVHIDEQMTYYKTDDDSPEIAIEKTTDLAATGGGATDYPTRSSAVVGVRGGITPDLEGAGDTSPRQPGTSWRNQFLRIPDWLLFGHELCGHALTQDESSPSTSHLMTPEGDRTAVDVENQIRRDRSTMTDNLGIRQGGFYAELVAGWEPVWLNGAVYRVGARETLTDVAARAGIPPAKMFEQIYRFDGKRGLRISDATKDRIAPGDELLIEGISWHTVIEGETLDSIAAMWSVPPVSLERANPRVAVRPGVRLLIPAR